MQQTRVQLGPSRRRRRTHERRNNRGRGSWHLPPSDRREGRRRRLDQPHSQLLGQRRPWPRNYSGGYRHRRHRPRSGDRAPDPAEAAEATGEAVIQSAITWVCTAIARNTIADAEVAALVGGFVGQYGGKLVTYGIRVAILGRNPDPKWDDAYDALLTDTSGLELACAAEREELAALGRQHHIAFTEHVLPALEDLTASSGAYLEATRDVDADADLIALAAIADQFAGTPLFDSLEAFDTFMADPNSTLVLNLSRE